MLTEKAAWDILDEQNIKYSCGLPTVFTMLRQRRLQYVRRMKDGRIHKYILYGKLIAGKSNLGRPHLRYRDVCKGAMKDLNTDLNK